MFIYIWRSLCNDPLFVVCMLDASICSSICSDMEFGVAGKIVHKAWVWSRMKGQYIIDEF